MGGEDFPSLQLQFPSKDTIFCEIQNKIQLDSVRMVGHF